MSLSLAHRFVADRPLLDRFRLSTGGLIAALTLAACGGGGTGPATPSASTASLSAAASLGERIFNDPSLSASGRLSCASCHDATHGSAPANNLAVQLGGTLLDHQGIRSAPSIRYLSFNREFHYEADGTPTGGFFWDGRARNLAEQAASPLLGVNEMANASAADFTARLARASYAAIFQQTFGADIFDRPDEALARATFALQQYQREDGEFTAFSSKYDEFLRGRAQLSDAELRGLALFNRADKGNCQACHPSAKSADGTHPLFTDFSYDNLGVPRNPELARNADPTYFDLGLCARPDGSLAAREDLCGAFKVPSLRNVAMRGALFHNGRFKTLKDALTFYVQRDTNPEKWYPTDPDGTVHKFDDLPTRYQGNVNTTEVPYDRKPGDTPALSDSEIDDVISFLKTLDDGYAP